MKLTQQYLRNRLETLTADLDVQRYIVAFSGGLDSTVLLHALSQDGVSSARDLLAVHVNHGLQDAATGWSRHCEEIAAELGVACECREVQVDVEGAAGPEAAAREARYKAFRELMRPGDCLLSAHHREDQAETVLLNLLRGSGPAGLAAIAARQEFGCGYLLRPLLSVPRLELEAYANAHDLHWVDDPTNLKQQFDRNFLRHELIPLLQQRWPAATARLARSAELAREANDMLNALADIDLAPHESATRLDVPLLRELPEARQRNLLRRAVALCGLPAPPSTRLQQAIDELLPARDDAQPLVAWNGAELRRYRDKLFIMSGLPAHPLGDGQQLLPDGADVSLGTGLGALRLVSGNTVGISPQVAGEGLQIRFRRGGEEIRPSGSRVTRKLKKLLQEDGVLPWMRERVPLLYAGERLVAVANLWIAADCIAQGGLQIDWRDRPPLH